MKRNLTMWLGGALMVASLAVSVTALAGGDPTDLERINAAPGDNFKLGKVNAVRQVTKLINNQANNNEQLQVNNNTTTSLARAIGARSEGSASTIESINGGNGPALSLIVNPGRAPFTTNSTARVTNLNADLIDGQNGPFLRDDFYTKQNNSAGNNTPNAATTIQASCDAGDELISGGYFGIDDAGTTVLANFPNQSEQWEVTIRNDGTADTITVVANCANTA